MKRLFTGLPRAFGSSSPSRKSARRSNWARLQVRSLEERQLLSSLPLAPVAGKPWYTKPPNAYTQSLTLQPGTGGWRISGTIEPFTNPMTGLEEFSFQPPVDGTLSIWLKYQEPALNDALDPNYKNLELDLFELKPGEFIIGPDGTKQPMPDQIDGCIGPNIATPVGGEVSSQYQYSWAVKGCYYCCENIPYTLEVDFTPAKGAVLPVTPVQPGQISGQVYQADTHAGLAGRTVFLDTNGNGLPDKGEAQVTTNSLGAYTFNNVAPGKYTVHELLSPGEVAKTPNPVPVVVTSGAKPQVDFAVTPPPSATFRSFSVTDASMDDSPQTVFQDSALRVSYDVAVTGSTLKNVTLEARGGGRVTALAHSTGAQMANELVNLATLSSPLPAGQYDLYEEVQLADGKTFDSALEKMTVLNVNKRPVWTFQTKIYTYNDTPGTGTVYIGNGGMNTLKLTVPAAKVASIDGVPLAGFKGETTNQAIYRGSAYDYLRLTDGAEIYFQGIEKLNFSDGKTLDLTSQVTPNDPLFPAQWNLQISGVTDAWRFTQGSANVLLVSLDTGLSDPAGQFDLNKGREITDPSSNDNLAGSSLDPDYKQGHGDAAISIMAATANDGKGIAGINWNSPVYITDLYGSSRVTLQQAISEAMNYAYARGMRVVFQGGIQGEDWLSDPSKSGGSEAQLEQLITNIQQNISHPDDAVFAIAAGNGGVDMNNLNAPPNTSGGVARLASTYSDVISVGALLHTSDPLYGPGSSSSVSRDPKTNFGASLTLTAPSNIPAINNQGNRFTNQQGGDFSGTSSANPNVAGIASLVWSVDPKLTGSQVRQILVDTAMDLGAPGRDNDTGYGLVNASAAVRRAEALARSPDLALLVPLGTFVAPR